VTGMPASAGVIRSELLERALGSLAAAGGAERALAVLEKEGKEHPSARVRCLRAILGAMNGGPR
jgi:hypothetical protein